MYQTTTISLMVKETPNPTIKVHTPNDVLTICSDMAQLSQESVQILTVNSHNKLINRHLVTLGIADASLIHPREIFLRAIKDNASAFILVHNHPSGDTNPSAEDLKITRQIIEAGKILEIKCLDHVIIGDKALSIRETGMCNFY